MAETPPEFLAASLKGLCPRCGAQTLFAGVLQFSKTCPKCGLNFEKFNVGDGASAALILLIGTVFVAGMARSDTSLMRSPKGAIMPSITPPVHCG